MPRQDIEKNREIAKDFLDYLEERKLIKTWFRPHLAEHFDKFKQARRDDGLATTTFSQTLFALSRFKELQVRGGKTIVFRDTDDWNTRSAQFIPNATRIPGSIKKDWELNVEGIQVVPVGEATVENLPGHFVCRFSEYSANAAVIEFEIQNNREYDIQLRDYKCISKSSNFQMVCDDASIIPSMSGKRVSVLSTLSAEVSTTEIELELVLQGNTEYLLRYLKYSHVVEGDISSDEEEEEKSKPKFRFRMRNIIPGEKPDSMYDNKLKMTLALPANDIPKKVIDRIKRGVYNLQQNTTLACEEGDEEAAEELKRPLDMYNYSRKFKLLLHIEEWQNKQDIKRYDIHEAALMKRGRGNLLYLKVPGLAEKRPSVLRGDRVYAQQLTREGEATGNTYEGFVHIVELEEVGIRFHGDFHRAHIQNMKYYVRFTFNRLPLKLMHRSISLIMSRLDVERMLFPLSPPAYKAFDKRLVMFNRDIDSNDEQRNVVHKIVLGETSPIYVIYGPPGTGKTITMVEVIHQILREISHCHVLVCAPSNSACDLLASRLMEHVDKNKIMRMHAASRFWDDVPSKVQEISNYNGSQFVYPSKENLMEYRIIVTTLITAGRIASAKFPPQHFDRVFIDESGQAMEPEALVPLAGVLAEKGKVILAGDPKQLGPIIRSSIANRNGLQTSLLERLVDSCSIYKKEGYGLEYNSQCITKLLRNYRSHESIIKVSNEKFYDNQLMVHADKMMRTSLCQWEGLPQVGFPLIFHGVQGEDKQESTSPSFYNPHEIKIVKDYVESLLDIRGKKVRAEDIGIITPYRKQVKKIRQAVKDPRIKVGTVEEFQGQERLVIIISTVRSNTKYLQFDKRFNLGFLRNPKRFNVAVTRAKALLIIVGNPRILCHDENWRAMLEYCIQMRGYKGVRFTQADIEDEISDVSNIFAGLSISTNGRESSSDQANPQWRQDP